MNLFRYSRIFYHRQFLLQLRMSRSYNGLFFGNTYLTVLPFITVFAKFYYTASFWG
jgi:hypothetical protein